MSDQKKPDPIFAALENSLREAASTLTRFQSDSVNVAALNSMAQRLAECFKSGHKVLACGNGGSACDAIHFSEEFTGRFRKHRKALPAIALTESSHLTCVANDYGWDEVFARGVEAYGKPGDILVAISTSGNSPNVIRAVEVAKSLDMGVFLLLGKSGGQLKTIADKESHILKIVVESETTERIQEIHITALHILIECVERILFPENY